MSAVFKLQRPVFGDMPHIAALIDRFSQKGSLLPCSVNNVYEQLLGFVLTYETAFFEKFGFSEYSKDNLPQKGWKDCVHCPQFQNCDETAMLPGLANGANQTNSGDTQE